MTIKGWKLLVHQRCEGKCVICGSTTGLTVHHKVPVSKGGKNSPENTVCWCRLCHRTYHKLFGRTPSDDKGHPLYGYITPEYIKRKHKSKRKKHYH